MPRDALNPPYAPLPVGAPAPPAAVETSATSTSVGASTTPAAVTAALGERQIWCESQSCESSKHDQGFKPTRFTHNFSFPSSVAARFQSRSLWPVTALSHRILVPARELRGYKN